MFTGKRIRLTALREEDLVFYQKWMGDPAVGRSLGALPIREETRKNAEKLLEEKSPNTYMFAIRPLEDDSFLGMCAIEDILWPHRVGWLAISLGPDYQGKGYGKEALQLLLHYGFNELNLHRIQLTVFDYNAGAIKLYESLGFKKEGLYREFLQRDGKRYDMHLYGMLHSEFSV